MVLPKTISRLVYLLAVLICVLVFVRKYQILYQELPVSLSLLMKTTRSPHSKLATDQKAPNTPTEITSDVAETGNKAPSIDKVRDHDVSLGGFYQVGDEDIYIYSAFLDARYDPQYVRMFGMQPQKMKASLRCIFTLYNGSTFNSSSDKNYAIFGDWPSSQVQYMAHQYACEIPDSRIVSSVSKLEVYILGSQLRNMLPLKTIGRSLNEPRQTLAVCVKAVWGRLEPGRLVEWIETNLALGVEKFFLYNRGLVGPASRVLEYYKERGQVEVIPFTYVLEMGALMADDPMRFKLRHEEYILEQGYLVSINDCYYRLRDQYKYILLIDIDELLVPVRNESLTALIVRASTEQNSASSFIFPSAWHFDELGVSPASKHIPNYMHMHRHLRRTHIMNPANDQPKAILDTDGSVTLNWHGSVRFPNKGGYRGNYKLKWSDYGFIHHFRDKCILKYDEDECEFMKSDTVEDQFMPKLTDVSESVAFVLKKLGVI